MAVLSQCFSYYCCMESLGKLPPRRFGHHMADVSAILRIFSGAGRWRIQAAAATPAHRSRSQPRQHRQQLSAASSRKKSTLEAKANRLPGLPVPRRESPVVVLAVPPRRPCLPGRTPAPPPPLPPVPRCGAGDRRAVARGRAGSAVSLDFCDDCKEPCLNSITVCGWVRC